MNNDIKNTQSNEGFFFLYSLILLGLTSSAILGFAFKSFDSFMTLFGLAMYVIYFIFIFLAQKFNKRFLLIVPILYTLYASAFELIDLRWVWVCTFGFSFLVSLIFTYKKMAKEYKYFISKKKEKATCKFITTYFYIMFIIPFIVLILLILYNEYLFCSSNFWNYINPFSYIIASIKTFWSPLGIGLCIPIAIGYLFIDMNKE